MAEKKQERKVSVRALVEFLLRSGDLDNRGGGWADRDAMQEGSRIHRKIQKRMGGGYQAEVPLRFRKEYEHFILSVEGRADGVITGQDGVTIDEIKGVYRNVEQMRSRFRSIWLRRNATPISTAWITGCGRSASR